MRVEVRDLLLLVTEREVGAGAWRTCWAMNGVPTKARPGAASNERHTADTIGDIVSRQVDSAETPDLSDLSAVVWRV